MNAGSVPRPRDAADYAALCAALDEIRSRATGDAVTLLAALRGALVLHQPVGRHCGRDHERWPCHEYIAIRKAIMSPPADTRKGATP